LPVSIDFRGRETAYRAYCPSVQSVPLDRTRSAVLVHRFPWSGNRASRAGTIDKSSCQVWCTPRALTAFDRWTGSLAALCFTFGGFVAFFRGGRVPFNMRCTVLAAR
jgi:hypothetical protein